MLSRIDYCNSLLFGVSAAVRPSQRLYNLCLTHSPASIITCRLRFDQVTPALRDESHWLPIQQRIQYKIALLLFKCLHGMGSAYLSAMCIPEASLQNNRMLRSVAHGDIVQPRTHTRRIGPRSFSSAAPALWNSLPASVKNSSLIIIIINIFLIYKLLTPLVD